MHYLRYLEWTCLLPVVLKVSINIHRCKKEVHRVKTWDNIRRGKWVLDWWPGITMKVCHSWYALLTILNVASCSKNNAWFNNVFSLEYTDNCISQLPCREIGAMDCVLDGGMWAEEIYNPGNLGPRKCPKQNLHLLIFCGNPGNHTWRAIPPKSGTEP